MLRMGLDWFSPSFSLPLIITRSPSASKDSSKPIACASAMGIIAASSAFAGFSSGGSVAFSLASFEKATNSSAASGDFACRRKQADGGSEEVPSTERVASALMRGSNSEGLSWISNFVLSSWSGAPTARFSQDFPMLRVRCSASLARKNCKANPPYLSGLDEKSCRNSSKEMAPSASVSSCTTASLMSHCSASPPSCSISAASSDSSICPEPSVSNFLKVSCKASFSASPISIPASSLGGTKR
mmetsp:Transcript_5924/g.10605  ORF Transcript_5924/g.10605 Transcript_5924/m.10605 type:complete len:243 (-) Transcript_5924:1824-2552(-)